MTYEISIIDNVHVKPKSVGNLISHGMKINAAIVKSNPSIEANLSEIPSSSKHVPNHMGNFNSKIGTSGRSVTKQPHMEVKEKSDPVHVLERNYYQSKGPRKKAQNWRNKGKGVRKSEWSCWAYFSSTKELCLKFAS